MDTPDKFMKFDGAKPSLSNMKDFMEELGEVHAIIEYGAAKYERGNWQQATSDEDLLRYTNAAIRHLLLSVDSEYDEESGFRHLAHCICNLLFIGHIQRGKAQETNEPQPENADDLDDDSLAHGTGSCDSYRSTSPSEDGDTEGSDRAADDFLRTLRDTRLRLTSDHKRRAVILRELGEIAELGTSGAPSGAGVGYGYYLSSGLDPGAATGVPEVPAFDPEAKTVYDTGVPEIQASPDEAPDCKTRDSELTRAAIDRWGPLGTRLGLPSPASPAGPTKSGGVV